MHRNRSTIAAACPDVTHTSVKVQELDWCKWGEDGHFLSDEVFDLILVSDGIFKQELRDALDRVLVSLTDRNRECVVLMAMPFRHEVDFGLQAAWFSSLAPCLNDEAGRGVSQPQQLPPE